MTRSLSIGANRMTRRQLGMGQQCDKELEDRGRKDEKDLDKRRQEYDKEVEDRGLEDDKKLEENNQK